VRIGIITGTMPDIIKQAPLVWEAESRGHEVILIHSGQHLDDIRFKEIAISIGLRSPDILYSNNEWNIPLAIHWFSQNLILNPPLDIVLPHGDTTTSMIASVIAHYNNIPVGHVEAGLRTGSREPWPEQTNTRISDACSNLFFAATDRNYYDLIHEGFKRENITICGNTVIDIAKKIASSFSKIVTNKVYFSAHREENMRFKERVKNIVLFANFLADEGLEVQWVLRPKADRMLDEYEFKRDERINYIKGLPYTESIRLINESLFVCTDSGGLQEESSALHVPCLTMRYVTDRPETVEVGCNIITTLDIKKMKDAYYQMRREHGQMSSKKCPYGDGNTAQKIIDFIEYRKNNLITWEK